MLAHGPLKQELEGSLDRLDETVSYPASVLRAGDSVARKHSSRANNLRRWAVLLPGLATWTTTSMNDTATMFRAIWNAER